MSSVFLRISALHTFTFISMALVLVVAREDGSGTLPKIVDGKLDAKLAYATGKLKCKGDIAYAFKLTVLM